MIEQEVARHYTHGTLEAAIAGGLKALGREDDSVTIDDLAAIDEFHMGGRAATVDLTDQLKLDRGASVLDIGSGLGGTARFLASRYGCRVAGVDLTPEYVAVAERLTTLVGLAGQVQFKQGSALHLPFPDGTFDTAVMLHVGMNIPDKEKLCAEAARVLKVGGTFAVYDVMQAGPGPVDFPMPWADTSTTSFVEKPETYRAALTVAGFEIVAERDRREMALRFFLGMKERLAAEGRRRSASIS